MRSLLASLFRHILGIQFFKERYFAFQKYIFRPYHLFKGVHKDVIYRNSIRLHLSLADWIQQQLYFLGDYEKNEIDYLYSTLKEGDTFIDIGANIGLFSLNAAQIVKNTGSIYSFEAFTPNYSTFKKHIEMNTFRNITPEHLAIAGEKGHIEILYNEDYDNVGMASSFLRDFTSREKVESISLDEYVKQKQISKLDLIKIDIEGGEYAALTGMKETLRIFRPGILIEINTAALRSSDKSEEELIGLLSEYGYIKTKVLSRNDNSYNAVFVFA